MSDEPFTQDPPRPSNRFRTDGALRSAVRRLLPEERYALAAALLDDAGERAIEEWRALGMRAEQSPPRHVPYDPWGRRIDRIEVDPSWTRLVAIGAELGLVALPYEETFGARARVVQAALLQLFGAVSATASCPLAMTDGATRVLLAQDDALARRYVPRLIARRGGWTCAQWMTETTGGSDVGRTRTRAVARDDGTWELYGTKWFTSATTADLALALARPDGAESGSRGLSLFALELRDPSGGWNRLRVRRLKEKLGTKALPTAELDLEGTPAVAVGGLGRGVAKIAGVLNVARLWAALGAVAGVGELLSLARDYASRREVFGKPLREQPVHRVWLGRIAAEYEGMLLLAFDAARAIGEAEHGGDPLEARVLAPLAKLACARDAVDACSHLIESFGGAGYIEDTGLPQIFRDVHVHCIWEGTTTVLALDLLRALDEPGAMQQWFDRYCPRIEAIAGIEPGVGSQIDAALGRVRALLETGRTDRARGIARGLSRIHRAVLLAEAVAAAPDEAERSRSRAALRVFTAAPLLEEDADVDASELEVLAFGETVRV
jgi:alkylation response protein AidB-like acyl-CoA dehydrogenase